MNKFYFINKPDIEGFDTETYKGNVKLITSSDNYKEPKTFADLLNFLWYNGKELNFFYNLGFDFSVILKSYLLENPDMAKSVREIRYFEFDDYKVSFVPNKGFSIRKGKQRRKKRYFDISQFYNDGHFRTLDEVSKNVLNVGKNNEELEIDRKKIGTEEGYYEQNRDKIIKYGMQDASLTKRLAEIKVQEVFNFLNVYPKLWYSSASISKAYLELHHKKEKWSFWHLVGKNKTFFYYVFQSYFGGIFLSKKLGAFEQASEIDINSAYPKAITTLYSLVGAFYKRVSEPSGKCDYGFYRVKVKYNGLIPYRTKTNIIYPVSLVPVETIMTAIEYEYWKGKTEIKFIDGYEIFTKREHAFPEFVDIYKQRQKLKKEKTLNAQMRQWNMKIVLNATYGTFAQSKNGYTYWTNFVYASYITAITRLIIYKAIEKVGFDNVIAIMTDAILFHNVDWKGKDTDELGKFKTEFKDNAIILYMNGLMSYEEELSNENTLYFPIISVDLKKRGFPSLKPEDLKGNTNAVEVQRIKVRKLLESIIQKKVETIGDFIPEIKTLDLKSNLHKYDYPENKLTFEYLNAGNVEGEPILVAKCQKYRLVDWDEFDKMSKAYAKYRKYIAGRNRRRKNE